MAENSSQYIPKRMSSGGEKLSLEALAEYLEGELDALAQHFNNQDLIWLKERFVAPAKPRTGMVVLADGTEWDPGAGAGFYGYYGAAWVKLG